MLEVFIGWDSREIDAYKVCEHSIHKHTNNARVRPLKQQALRKLGIYNRPLEEKAATEFAFSRFFVPWMTKYKGYAIFCDCDMLFTCDLDEIFYSIGARKAVYVVQHDYTPRHTIKMDGQVQQSFPRKNWSSFILWDCSHPANARLTLDYCNTASAAELHQFKWLKDSQIGDLALSWNWLEGEYSKPSKTPRNIHYTQGGLWFENIAKERYVDYGEEWLQAWEETGAPPEKVRRLREYQSRLIHSEKL